MFSSSDFRLEFGHLSDISLLPLWDQNRIMILAREFLSNKISGKVFDFGSNVFENDKKF